MQIQQKKRSNKHTFTFQDDSFNFAYQDKRGSGDMDLHYADFPQKSSVTIEQNEWLRNVGYLWCALGVYQLGYASYSGTSLSGKGFWLMVGLACVAWAYYSKVKYSVFKTDKGNVFVIQGDKHDRIIAEINQRRKNQLLQWYGDIDPENDPENEIRKFQWLRDQQVMSQEDAEEKIAQIELTNKTALPLTNRRLN